MVDLAALAALVRFAHLAAVPAAMIGVALGSLIGFALNKYLAFRDHVTPVLPQLGRYLATLGTAMLIHACLMYLLVNRLGVHYILAKLFADFLVFTCGSLAVMRFYVFRRLAGESPPASCPESEIRIHGRNPLAPSVAPVGAKSKRQTAGEFSAVGPFDSGACAPALRASGAHTS